MKCEDCECLVREFTCAVFNPASIGLDGDTKLLCAACLSNLYDKALKLKSELIK